MVLDYREKIAIDNLNSLITEMGNLRKKTEKCLSEAEPYSQEIVEDNKFWIIHNLERSQELLMEIRSKM
jgi:hypothetical protein